MTHFFGLWHTRLNGIISSPCPEVTRNTFGFPVCARRTVFLAVNAQNGPFLDQKSSLLV